MQKSDGYEDYRWSLSATNAFKIPSDPSKWDHCPTCQLRPKIWEFDNGMHAKCCCSGMYEESQAEFEGPFPYYRRTGTFQGYRDTDGLRDAWNDYVTSAKGAK